MALHDYQSFNHPNQVRASDYSGNIRHGWRSKAQTSLNKILHIISSFPPSETSRERCFCPQFGGLSDESRGLCCGKRGFGIDLNLRLGPLTEEERDSTVVESNSPEVEKSSEGECEAEEEGRLDGHDFSEVEANRNGEDVEVVGEKETDVSEITSVQVKSFEPLNNDKVCEETKVGEEEQRKELQGDGDGGVKPKSFCKKQCKREGFLGLLIEAAELISGEFNDDEPEPEPEPEPERPSRNNELEHELSTHKVSETETAINESTRGRSKSKGNQVWMADLYGDFGDISPVVRSKRGRNQVLPYRYRDSVLEPWRRLSRQRSSTTKRRSR